MSKRRNKTQNTPPAAEAERRPGLLAEARVPAALAVASALLLWMAFPPLEWGWLGWLALAPLIAAMRSDRRPGGVYLGVWVGGLVFFLLAVHWLRYADPKAWAGWVGLAVYLSAYWPLAAWLVRRGVVGLRLPAVAVVPPVLVALDFLRAHLMTGFAWYFLGHTQAWFPWMIQVCDLGGVYAVTFVMAAVNGLAADLWAWRRETDPARRLALGRWCKPATLVVGLLVAGVLVYGAVRVRQVHDQLEAGPKVAVLQGNEAQRVKENPEQWFNVLRRHMRLTLEAAKDKPDLIAWPETMFTRPWITLADDVTDADIKRVDARLTLQRLTEIQQANVNDLKLLRETMARTAGDADIPLLIGQNALKYTQAGLRKTNSARLFAKDNTVLGHYDKMHLVPFGEYLPLADALPWLNVFTPYHEGYSIDAGAEPTAFDLGGRRFGVIICFEDTVPRVVRRFAQRVDGRRRTDFLLNISNDGWFGGSSELDAHLALCVFRAVENRVPILRAVNTGISAAIAPTGATEVFRDAAGRSKLSTGHLTRRVQLFAGSSLYTEWGDLWAGVNALAVLVLLGWSAVRRRAPGSIPSGAR